MTSEQLLREIEALPEAERRQVADFVAFLRSRARQRRPRRPANLPPISEDPAIGMWWDREEMRDSVAWVRSVRQREWARGSRRQHPD
jgi:hypothetical protein